MRWSLARLERDPNQIVSVLSAFSCNLREAHHLATSDRYTPSQTVSDKPGVGNSAAVIFTTLLFLSEREVRRDVNPRSCSLYAIAVPYVCRLSVTFVRPS